MPLERLHHGQNDRGREKSYRHLVEPAVPQVRLRVSVARKIGKQPSAVQMIGDQQYDDPELGVEPGTGEAVAEPQPYAEDERQYRAGRHNAPVELAFHDLEPLPARRVLGHGVIDEQAWQVEKPRQPKPPQKYFERPYSKQALFSTRFSKRRQAPH